VERGTVRVKCLAQKHNTITMFPAELKPRLLKIEKKYKNQITGCIHRLLKNLKMAND